MPSLRDLTLVYRLNAPTRAAATRRRRLRKAVTAALVVLAAVIALPSGGSRGNTASATPPDGIRTGRSELAGRHAVALPGSALPVGTSRADVWNERGVRLVACAPVVPAATHEQSVTSTTPPLGATLALTDAQVAKIAPLLGDSTASGTNLIVSGCL